MEQVYHLGVKALIENHQGKVLVLRVSPHLMHDGKTTYWDLPGGRVDYGEKPGETLRREVKEEIGVNLAGEPEFMTMVLSQFRIPKPEGDIGLILACYRCRLEHEDIALSEAHTEFAWVDRAEAAERISTKYPAEFLENFLG